MIQDITYIINSHGDYSLPLEKLLGSMAYIPSDRIVIVRGGMPLSQATGTWHGNRLQPILTIDVDHDSYDYTGMIALQDLAFDTADHIFFLQDTMEFGMNTDYLIKQANAEHDATAVYGGQCNLVLYRADYILSHSVWQFIQDRRNLSKLDSIHYEGALWKRLKLKDHYPNSSLQLLGIEYPYSNIPRTKEYYPAIDLVKWKANWGQNMHALVLHP